jgi:Tfp pilus assembly protein PilV
MQTTHRLQPARGSVGRRSIGISLIETVLSLLIISGAFVASLNAISGARASQAIAAQQRLGLVLAEDLMAEILSQPYKESTLLGLEFGENTGDRSNFDDIDDYKGWTSTPPTDVNGNVIEGTTGYTRKVQVNYVRLWSPTETTLSDQGMLRIIVTVTRGGKEVARLTSYRSDIYESSGVGF